MHSQVPGSRVWTSFKGCDFIYYSSLWAQKTHPPIRRLHSPFPTFTQILIHYIINSEPKISSKYQLKGQHFCLPMKLENRLSDFKIQWRNRQIKLTIDILVPKGGSGRKELLILSNLGIQLDR